MNDSNHDECAVLIKKLAKVIKQECKEQFKVRKVSLMWEIFSC